MVSFGPSFALAGGMGGTSKISSLEAVIEHLKERFNAVISGLWDVVAAFGRLEAVTQEVALGSQIV